MFVCRRFSDELVAEVGVWLDLERLRGCGWKVYKKLTELGLAQDPSWFDGFRWLPPATGAAGHHQFGGGFEQDNPYA